MGLGLGPGLGLWWRLWLGVGLRLGGVGKEVWEGMGTAIVRRTGEVVGHRRVVE